MARTPDRIIQDMIGQVYIQLAVAQSTLEFANEEIAVLKQKLLGYETAKEATT